MLILSTTRTHVIITGISICILQRSFRFSLHLLFGVPPSMEKESLKHVIDRRGLRIKKRKNQNPSINLTEIFVHSTYKRSENVISVLSPQTELRLIASRTDSHASPPIPSRHTLKSHTRFTQLYVTQRAELLTFGALFLQCLLLDHTNICIK